MNASTYTAWNGESYPWPPPDGWYQASDGRWWPQQETPQAVPFAAGPTAGSAAGPAPIAPSATPLAAAPTVGQVPADDDKSQRSRIFLILGLAAVVVCVLLVAGVMALLAGSDDDSAQPAEPTTTAPATTEPETTATATTAPATTGPTSTDSASTDPASTETSQRGSDAGERPANLSTSGAQSIDDAHAAGLPFVMQNLSPDLAEPVTVLIEFIGPMRAATDEVMAENSLNDPPEAGHQFYMQRARLTIMEGPLSDPDLVYFGVDFDGDPQYTFNRTCGVVPDRLNAIPAFVPQTPQEFNACWQLSEDEAANATYFLKFSGPQGSSMYAQIPRG